MKLLPGETRVVMEYTGNYYEPIARYLHNGGIYVSVVNAMLLHNYSGNSIRKDKRTRKTLYALHSTRLTVGLTYESIFPMMKYADH